MRTFFEKIVFLMLLALLFACHPKQDDSVETQDLASLQPVPSMELQVIYPAT